VTNKIVEYLLDNGGIDMNDLARMDFTAEDRQQFAQLIGYSLSGYGSLSYVSDEAYDAAQEMADNPIIKDYEARNKALTTQLNEARDHIRNAALALFRVHPDDLNA
jgi:hypothetical protein